MYNLWAITVLGQEQPSPWRLLAPLVTIIAIAVFGWLNERIKQKERQQQAEDETLRQREDEARTRRGKPTRETTRPRQAQTLQRVPLPEAQRQRRAGAGEGIHRYQPQVPSAGGRGGESGRSQTQQPQLIVVAEDLSVAAARRQLQREQQERLRTEAIRRARAQQARRQAKVARPKSLDLKPSREASQAASFPGTEIYQPSVSLLAPGQAISPAQIRRAIVWAEILGPPRALRPHSSPLGMA